MPCRISYVGAIFKKNKKTLANVFSLCYNINVAEMQAMQRYRSGHNGADSKSVCAKAHEGSNPSLCAKKTDGKGRPFFVSEGIRTAAEVNDTTNAGKYYFLVKVQCLPLVNRLVFVKLLL